MQESTNSPFFSIIVPVYNVAPYLRECMESVLAQAFPDWEAICVDDGSTDESGDILDEYAAKDRRFRVFHQPNAGVSAARNKGLDHASGEWISFIDSDDSVPDDYLSAFVQYKPKSDINFFQMCRQWPTGTFSSKGITMKSPAIGEGKVGDAILRLLYNETGDNLFGYTVNKFIRHSIVASRGIRFIEGFSESEDEVFTFEVCMDVSTLSILEAPIYHYRMRQGGLSSPKRREYGRRAKILADIGDRATSTKLKMAIYGQGCISLYRLMTTSLLLCQPFRTAGYICRYRQYIIWLSSVPRFVKLISTTNSFLGGLLVLAFSALHSVKRMVHQII